MYMLLDVLNSRISVPMVCRTVFEQLFCKQSNKFCSLSGVSVMYVNFSEFTCVAQVASQPINWPGQCPGAPKVLGASSSFADFFFSLDVTR